MEHLIHKAQRIRRMGEVYGEEFPKVISKSEFEEKYPLTDHEIYSLDTIHKYRQELNKTHPDTGDELFKAECRNLQQFLVYGEQGPKLIFVREKQSEG